MYLCVICRFLVEIDDAIVPTGLGRCICLRCFRRETNTTVVIDPKLRKEIVMTLAVGDFVPD